MKYLTVAEVVAIKEFAPQNISDRLDELMTQREYANPFDFQMIDFELQYLVDRVKSQMNRK